jgi:TonB-dependent receptor
VYANQENAFGFRDYPFVSPTLAWSAFQANPALFTKTPAQVVDEQTFALRNSEYIREKVSALYAQGEVKLFRGRLHVLGGIRYEKTVDDGRGALGDPAAVFVRNPDGTFARNASGARIRKPEAGAAGSLDELQLTLRERGFRAEKSYDGYYPSLHLTYNFSQSLLLRLAYARTFGRPNFTDIIPNTDIAEDDNIANPELATGQVSVRNTGLQPWHADNYDLSLEYYTRQGGSFSVGLFRKQITDFFGSAVRTATLADTVELGLDPRYVGWTITSRFNSGDARISGAEFSATHSLAPLGGWARHLSAFANGTKLKLEGNQGASFAEFIPENLNWGISFSRKPVIFMARWNYRGRQTGAAIPALGPDAFTGEDRHTTLDVNTEYRISKTMSLFVNIQNVFNSPIITLAYGPETPDYARRLLTSISGMTISLGIKGNF